MVEDACAAAAVDIIQGAGGSEAGPGPLQRFQSRRERRRKQGERGTMTRQDEGEESPESAVSSSSCDTVSKLSSGRRTCQPGGAWSGACSWVVSSPTQCTPGVKIRMCLRR